MPSFTPSVRATSVFACPFSASTWSVTISSLRRRHGMPGPEAVFRLNMPCLCGWLGS